MEDKRLKKKKKKLGQWLDKLGTLGGVMVSKVD